MSYIYNKVVKFIQSPWWVFFVGDPCLDRVDTSTIDIQVACFHACPSTVSCSVLCSLSYLPHSLMVDSGEESEVGMMSEQVESHAQKWAMSMVSALSIRQGSPTKKIHHGLWINFATFIFHIWHCNLVFCDSMWLCSHLPAWFRLIMTDNQWFTKCRLDPFGLLLVDGGGSGMPWDLLVGAPWYIYIYKIHQWHICYKCATDGHFHPMLNVRC